MKNVYIPQYITTTFFEDSAVLLDLRKDIQYALNESAAEFWKALMQLGSADSALREVLALYGDSSDVIKKDMEEFVRSLVQAGLLEKVYS